ncbi:MAG: glycosyltransferase [Solirubrobacteraceae bacterium]|nr:glycosyltransferase [Solirubrobacteraceae bacterium]
MTPTVSVCIPVYNGGPFIDETVRSILGQTYEDLEVIAVDNVSTDDSLERLRAHADADPRMRVIAAPDHVGAVENFRRATAACEAPYIKLVCADDTLAPDCLAQQVTAMEGHRTAALVASRRSIIDETGRVLIRNHGLRGLRGVVNGADAVSRCIRGGTNQLGEPAAVLIRAEMLAQTGSWSDEWPYMTDLELWFRLLRFGDLVALPDPLATFRVHTTGWSAAMGHTQAEQARRLFERERDHDGSAVTRRDVAVGAGKAQLMQYGRRGLYHWRNLAARRRVGAADASPRAAVRNR